jgi:ribosome-binding protein aMBF1 (putative translation factor)
MEGMDDNRGKPWLSAAEEAWRLPTSQVVRNLRETIGVRLVAYVGGATTASTVTAWAEGSAAPDADTASRLRTTLEVTLVLAQRWDPTTIGTWFKGANPELGDDAPARVIRESPAGQDHSVLVAARSAMIE